jgi:hypothetical protein
MTFACPTNETISAGCVDQPTSGHSTCNCSQRFQDIMPPSSPTENSLNTFLDDSTRALDVSFLVFSPTLQSYVFVHLLVEFSETGDVSVWDDYQSFSGRYSKQFDFSEQMTTLRISQYVPRFLRCSSFTFLQVRHNHLRADVFGLRMDRLDCLGLQNS